MKRINSALKNRNILTALFLLLVVTLLMITGCADGEPVKACVTGQPYDFFGGLWHGFIEPFDLIGMLIWDDVVVYATNNNGIRYAFGFLLGLRIWSLFF